MNFFEIVFKLMSKYPFILLLGRIKRVTIPVKNSRSQFHPKKVWLPAKKYFFYPCAKIDTNLLTHTRAHSHTNTNTNTHRLETHTLRYHLRMKE